MLKTNGSFLPPSAGSLKHAVGANDARFKKDVRPEDGAVYVRLGCEMDQAPVACLRSRSSTSAVTDIPIHKLKHTRTFQLRNIGAVARIRQRVQENDYIIRICRLPIARKIGADKSGPTYDQQPVDRPASINERRKAKPSGNTSASTRRATSKSLLESTGSPSMGQAIFRSGSFQTMERSCSGA